MTSGDAGEQGCFRKGNGMKVKLLIVWRDVLIVEKEEVWMMGEGT